MATKAERIARMKARYGLTNESFESDLISMFADENDHLVFNSSGTGLSSSGGGKTIRLNSRTESVDTANSIIGFQSKPRRGVSAATNVIGCEVSAQISDAIALTGSGSLIAGHFDVYLRGDAGTIAGDVRALQLELVDDDSAGRTVSGNVSFIRCRTNLSCAVTGKATVLRVENEEGAKALDGLVQFTTGSGAIVESAATVGGTQDQAIKVLVGTTTYYVPLYTSIS